MGREPLLLLALLAAACGGAADDAGTTTPPPVEDAAVAPAAQNRSQPPATEVAATNTGAITTSFDTVAARGERPLLRESYGWSGGGRDPFRPLVTAQQGGPELVDLTLVSVIYQSSNPSHSVAVFKDLGNSKRYTVSSGDRIGRLAVVSIGTGTVTLRMNDFGTTREQTYTIRQPMDVTP